MPSSRRPHATPSTSALVRDLRAELRRAADPAKAAPMRAYLKSSQPVWGVSAPALRAVVRRVADRHPLASTAAWRQAIGTIWDGATHREERHAAIALAGLPRYRRFETAAILPLYRRMIEEGAWWDLVDALAQRVGGLLAREPEVMTPRLRRWARDESLWIRRVAIIAQAGFRQYTDRHLLFEVIEPSLGARDFFLRKAIGWALREYAKAEPDVVRRYLDRVGPRLSPLSQREAAKGLAFAARRGPLNRTRSLA